MYSQCVCHNKYACIYNYLKQIFLVMYFSADNIDDIDGFNHQHWKLVKMQPF